MNSPLDPIRVAFKTHESSIRKAKSILRDYFNINRFYYSKLYSSGQTFHCESEIDLVDIYENPKFAQGYPSLCHPKFHQQGNIIYQLNDTPSLNNLEEFRADYLQRDIRLGFNMIHKTESYIEKFSVCSLLSTSSQSRFLCTHLSELRLFFKWFLESNRSLVAFLETNSFNLQQIVGNSFYEDKITGMDPVHIERTKFLRILGVETDIKFSAADLDVLKLILQGYTTHQISQRVYRTTRAIEYRIEKLKTNLNCNSRQALIEKVQELQNLGCLVAKRLSGCH